MLQENGDRIGSIKIYHKHTPLNIIGVEYTHNITIAIVYELLFCEDLETLPHNSLTGFVAFCHNNRYCRHTLQLVKFTSTY